MERCLVRLGRKRLGLLKDDFPRPLSEFERAKISKMMKDNLARFPNELLVAKPRPLEIAPQVLPHNIDITLSLIADWDPKKAIHSLYRLSQGHDMQPIGRDARFLDFIASCSRLHMLPSDYLIQLLHVVHGINPSCDLVERAIHELVVIRDLDGLASEDIETIAKCLHNDRYEKKLMEFAKNELNPQVLIALTPIGLRQGELVIPESLFPVLSKRDLVRVLEMMESCDFPHIISRTVHYASDCLTRLTFNRLVSETDKLELQNILAKLKLKLDAMVFIETNPFYSKTKKSNFVGKLLKQFSNDFDSVAMSLPLGQASERMVELSCLNRLQLKSVDTIANRIQAFGSKLLAPSGISPSQFSHLVWAMMNHPSAWKRFDRYRSAVGPQLARSFKEHMLLMGDSARMRCCEAIMKIQAKEVRSVVAAALLATNPSRLETSELLTGFKLSVGLVKRGEGLALETVMEYFDSIELEKLKTPQLVSVIEDCRTGKLVRPSEKTLITLTTRLANNGGLISPSNAVRVLTVIGDLQIRRCNDSIRVLTDSLGDMCDVDPRLSARVVNALANCGIANPEVIEESNTHIQPALLALSLPGKIENVFEDSDIAIKLNNSLKLLGSFGVKYREHLSSLPVVISGEPSNALVNSTESVTLGQLLDSHSKSPDLMTSKDEWEGLLPASMTTVGDLLGALRGTPTASTGDFEVETPYSWIDAKHRYKIIVVRDKHCARDDPSHILGSPAANISRDRINGWKVMVLPDHALMRVGTEAEVSLKRKVRRAKILNKNDPDDFNRLVSEFREILTSP